MHGFLGVGPADLGLDVFTATLPVNHHVYVLLVAHLAFRERDCILALRDFLRQLFLENDEVLGALGLHAAVVLRRSARGRVVALV